MPTFPMQCFAASPPQWRSLFSPGGCEYLEIKIPAAKFLLQIGIGNPRSEEYHRLDHRYRRHPTRRPPALPAQFPFALLRYGDRSSEIHDPELPLRVNAMPWLGLGPATIRWNGEQVSGAWFTQKTLDAMRARKKPYHPDDSPETAPSFDPEDISFHAQASTNVLSESIPGGAIREFAPFQVAVPLRFMNAPGTIAHVLAPHPTAEFAAHYLQSISQF